MAYWAFSSLKSLKRYHKNRHQGFEARYVSKRDTQPLWEEENCRFEGSTFVGTPGVDP